MSGRDVFVCLPTGFGKSVCYIVLPILFDIMRKCSDSVIVVVSPLKSLMADKLLKTALAIYIVLVTMHIHVGNKQISVAITTSHMIITQYLHSAFPSSYKAVNQTLPPPVKGLAHETSVVVMSTCRLLYNGNTSRDNGWFGSGDG